MTTQAAIFLLLAAACLYFAAVACLGASREPHVEYRWDAEGEI